VQKYLALGSSRARDDGILGTSTKATQATRIRCSVDLQNQLQVHKIIDKDVILKYNYNLPGH
jgi:hypothetical protein